MNFLYKLLSKILVDRMNEVASLPVSHNQTVFIKGRLISDNTILAEEMLKVSEGQSNLFRAYSRYPSPCQIR